MAAITITAEEEPALLTALQALDPEIHDLYLVAVGTLLRQENAVTLRRHQLRGHTLVADTCRRSHET